MTTCASGSRPVKGFTLVELMITVAVVAILGAIAYPSYTGYLRRSHRVDATAALLRIAAAQEKFYVQNNTYATTITTISTAASEHAYYTLSIPSASAATFTARAAATGAQSSDAACARLEIDASGAKRAFKSDLTTRNDAECWR